MVEPETLDAGALVPQLSVIQEESQHSSDTEEGDWQIQGISDLRRNQGKARSSHTKYISYLSEMLYRSPPPDRNEVLDARQKLVRLYDDIETQHMQVIEACTNQQQLDNEHLWFHTVTENHRRWLVELDRRITAATSVDGQSSRSVRSSRSSNSRRSSRSTETKLHEKERQIKEAELKVKQAQEEAHVRLEEEDRINRLDEEKRKEHAERTQRQLRNELASHQLGGQILQQQLGVERSGSRPTTPMEASSLLSSKSDAAACTTPAFTTQQRAEAS